MNNPEQTDFFVPAYELAGKARSLTERVKQLNRDVSLLNARLINQDSKRRRTSTDYSHPNGEDDVWLLLNENRQFLYKCERELASIHWAISLTDHNSFKNKVRGLTSKGESLQERFRQIQLRVQKIEPPAEPATPIALPVHILRMQAVRIEYYTLSSIIQNLQYQCQSVLAEFYVETAALQDVSDALRHRSSSCPPELSVTSTEISAALESIAMLAAELKYIAKIELDSMLPSLDKAAHESLVQDSRATWSAIESLIEKREAQRLEKFQSRENRRLQKSTAACTKSVLAVTAALKNLKQLLSRDAEAHYRCKELDKVRVSLGELLHVTQALRTAIRPQLGKIRSLAITSEDTLISCFRVALSSHDVVHSMLAINSEKLIKTMKESKDGIVLSEVAARQSADSLMKVILAFLENAANMSIVLETDMRQCLLIAQKNASVSDRENSDIKSQQSRIKEHNQLFAAYLVTIQKYRELNWRVFKDSPLYEAQNTRFEKRIRDEKDSFAARLNKDPYDKINPIQALSIIEEPIARILPLLMKLESCLSSPQNADAIDFKIALENSPGDQQSALSSEVQRRGSPTPSLPFNQQREQILLTLGEMLNAERELRSTTLREIEKECEKSELWLRRVLIARKIGDEELAKAAEERKAIHDETAQLLRTVIDGRLIQCYSLGQPFLEASEVVERIEKKLGLIPTEAIRESQLTGVLSLLDRVLLVAEGLTAFLDQSAAYATHEQKTVQTK